MNNHEAEKMARINEQKSTIITVVQKMLKEEFVGVEIKVDTTRSSKALTARIPLSEEEQKETGKDDIKITVDIDKQGFSPWETKYSLNFDVEYSYTRWSTANEYRMSRRGELGDLKEKLVADGFTKANIKRLRECVGRAMDSYRSHVESVKRTEKASDRKDKHRKELEAQGYTDATFQILKRANGKDNIGTVEVDATGYTMKMSLDNAEHVKKVHEFMQALLAAENQ